MAHSSGESATSPSWTRCSPPGRKGVGASSWSPAKPASGRRGLPPKPPTAPGCSVSAWPGPLARKPRCRPRSVPGSKSSTFLMCVAGRSPHHFAGCSIRGWRPETRRRPNGIPRWRGTPCSQLWRRTSLASRETGRCSWPSMICIGPISPQHACLLTSHRSCGRCRSSSLRRTGRPKPLRARPSARHCWTWVGKPSCCASADSPRRRSVSLLVR